MRSVPARPSGDSNYLKRGKRGLPVGDVIVQDLVVTAVLVIVAAVLRGDLLAVDLVGRQA